MPAASTKSIFAIKPAVQEQPVRLNGIFPSGLLEWNGGSLLTVLNAQFTDFAGLGGMLNLVTDSSLQCQLRDCWIGPGSVSPNSPPGNKDGFTNNLFERATLVIGTFDYLCPVYFYNNTVRHGKVQLDNDYGASGYRTVKDNLFDNSILTVADPGGAVYDHNAYFASSTMLLPLHTGDLTMSSLTYATGPLGNRYIDTGNTAPSLGDACSRQASAAGLWGYTILTNQIPDSGTVDIGYHYPITGNDSTGTDFWVAFFNMNDDSDGDNLSLYISSQSGAAGTLTIPEFGITNTFTVAAGGVTNVGITNTAMMLSDGITTNGIHIAASQPVSVYALDFAQGGTTAFTCYPTTLLGTNYCIMARTSFVPGSSELGIVATVDTTTVTITPSATVTFVRIFTPSTNIVLQQGQTYQMHSSDEMGDVTGTIVTSDKPIAVFAGVNEAYVPDGYTTGASNPLMQEQLPVNLWGTNALALAFAGRPGGDLYRVLAYTNTTVSITNSFGVSIITNLAAGTFCETNLDGWVQFQANQPIQVAQFAESAGTPEGDPCEILLQPIGHYLTSYTVVTLTNDLPDQVIGDFDENYMNLIVAQSGTNSTLVDGSLVAATNFMAIGNSGYYGAQLTMTNSGAHTVTSSQPVGVEVYGFGDYDTYGYFGGVVK